LTVTQFASDLIWIRNRKKWETQIAPTTEQLLVLITFESKSCLKLIKDNFCIPLIKEEFQFIAVPREMAQVIYINFDFL